MRCSTASGAKEKVVAAHQPGAGPKFSRVEMSGFEIIDHGIAAGRYLHRHL